MTQLGKRFLLGVIGVVVLLPGTALAGCDAGRSVRALSGPEPLTTDLRKSAEAGGVELFADGDFDREEFNYIGPLTLKNGTHLHVAQVETTWGESCRLTRRVLLYSDRLAYLGQYGGVSEPAVGTEADAILFRNPAGGTDRVVVAGPEPPKAIELDGQLHDFYK